MKILFITHYENLYGANNALLKLAIGIKASGHTPMVVLPTSGAMTEALETAGIDYFVCSINQWQAVYTGPVRFLIKKLKRKKEIFKEVEMLYEQFKDENIDIIHSNSSVIGQGALLAERLGAKHVWHIREFSKEHFNMRYFLKRKRVAELYNKADALIAISDALADNYRNKYPEANIVRIYDGVDKDNVPERKPVDKNVTRFVYVGYLFKMKHQLEVIKACKKLYEEGFTAFEMHFAGDGKDDYKKILKREIEKSGLSNIYLDGYVSNVDELLSSMDVGIIASEYEGFGLVTVEYMLSALPVIGRNGGGTSEIIADGETGFIFELEDELLAAMKKVMEEPRLRANMGARGRIRAKEKFNQNNNTKAVMQLYQVL